MKNVLAGVGAIFVKIWTWIKETAWIQPLLIVGIIFGVIFSIPSVTSWIQGLADDATSAETYYKKFDVSLKYDEDSAAQKIVNAMVDDQDTYGDKFFFILVQKGCSGCSDMQPAIKLLKEKTSRFYDTEEFGDFKFYTVFTSESVDDAYWDDQNGKYETAWDAFVDRNDEFLVKSADVASNSYYKYWGNIEDSAIEGLEDGSDMTTPTLFLFDNTESNSSGVTGISEVMFGVTGDTSYDKAELLAHCWTHSEEFSATGKK
jgi:hypothetical protein